jgi:hypothetical protein
VAWAAQHVCRRGDIDLGEALEEVSAMTEELTRDTEAHAQLVRDIVPPTFATQLAAQAEWPEPTDAERLIAVLQGLEQEQQLLIRWDEDTDHEEASGALRGLWTAETRGGLIVTHHDVDAAINGLGLCIGMMSCSPDVSRAMLAQLVIDALKAAGLPTWWPGDPRVPVVARVRWQVRLRD